MQKEDSSMSNGSNPIDRRRRLLRLSVAGFLAAALVAAGVFLSGVVFASHTFSDVPTAAFYHNAVEWMFNRGITSGCAAGLYCPNNSVTRGEIAVFLQKEGQVLTPVVIDTISANAPLDLDIDPVICATTSDHTPTYPQRAFLFARGHIRAAAGLGFRLGGVASTDGGATWFQTTPSLAQEVSLVANEAGASSYFGHLDLTVGTGYRFGIRVSRTAVDGLGDASDHRCHLMVEIRNRNPTSSPF